MKKIVFGITNLNLGGAERVLVDLANKLSQKYDITIFTIYGGGDFEKALSSNVKLINMYDFKYEDLSKIKKLLLPLKIFFTSKNIYKKYIQDKFDVDISFLEGPITRIFATKNKETKKIAWVHNDISLVFGKTLKSKIKVILNKVLYKKYEQLIFVSKDNLEKFNKIYNIEIQKKVIYNYIDRENVANKAILEDDKDLEKLSSDTFNFVTVARLVEQKAIDRLINVHSKLINDGFMHKIFVVGTGPLKEKLEEQVERLNVKDTFILFGKRGNPYPYIKKADYFCLLSYFEGYGMVLEEAKILGKNIAITNTAAREAVEGYDKAIIFENTEDGIYEGMKDILLNKDRIDNKIQGNNDYNNENIIDEIIEVLENLMV